MVWLSNCIKFLYNAKLIYKRSSKDAYEVATYPPILPIIMCFKDKSNVIITYMHGLIATYMQLFMNIFYFYCQRCFNRFTV